MAGRLAAQVPERRRDAVRVERRAGLDRAAAVAVPTWTPRGARQGLKVDAADPGDRATGLDGHSGRRALEQGQGAAVAVGPATLDDAGPSASSDETGPVRR